MIVVVESMSSTPSTFLLPIPLLTEVFRTVVVSNVFETRAVVSN